MNKGRDIHQHEPCGDAVKHEREISRRELLRRLSPLGKVKLDSSRCTGCGLCAAECPTEALLVSSSEETNTYQLLFKHSLCVACGRCIQVCPEQCLRLERGLELDKIDNPVSLFEDEIARCAKCGKPIGPRAMVNKIKAKVLATGHSSSSQFELCSECKVKVQISQLRT